jgi:hypothetical protein
MKIKEWRKVFSPVSLVWAAFTVGVVAVLIYRSNNIFSDALQGIHGMLIGWAIVVILAGSYWTIPYLVRFIHKCQLWIFGDEPINLALLLRFFGAVLFLAIFGPIWAAIVLTGKIDQKVTSVVRWMQDKNKW